MKTLVLLAHPNLRKSAVNREIGEVVRRVEGVTLHDLYSTYPDFFIDVAREKNLLEQHELIVFLHPFYWYSCPPLLKLWMDEVLELHWAYGPGGTRLHGKYFWQVVSCGGSPQAYQPTGNNHFTVLELLRPFEQTALLCGMKPLDPLIFYSARRAEHHRIQEHAATFEKRLRSYLGREGLQTYSTVEKSP